MRALSRLRLTGFVAVLLVLAGCDTGGVTAVPPTEGGALHRVGEGTFIASMPGEDGKTIKLRGTAKISASIDPEGPSVELQLMQPAEGDGPAYHITLSSDRHALWPTGTYAVGADAEVKPKVARLALTPSGAVQTRYPLGAGEVELIAATKTMWGAFRIETSYGRGGVVEGQFHAVRTGK